MKSIWTVSNLISVFRAVLAIPFAYVLWYDHKTAAVILAFLAYFSDLADGYIARKMNQVSEWGKIFDPIADKIFVGVGTLLFFLKGIIPPWFAAAILARDLIIMAGGIYTSKKLNFVLPSNYTGKVTVGLIGLVMVAVYLGCTFMEKYGFIAVTVAMVISLLHYTVRAIKELKKAGK